jgi:hypothetical protein
MRHRGQVFTPTMLACDPACCPVSRGSFAISLANLDPPIFAADFSIPPRSLVAAASDTAPSDRSSVVTCGQLRPFFPLFGYYVDICRVWHRARDWSRGW